MDKRRDSMTVRERFRAVMNFQPFDRLPIVEWANYWTETIQRWYGEALPNDIKGREALSRHFGLDLWFQDWMGARSSDTPAPETKYGPIIRTHDDYTRIRPTLFRDEGLNVEQLRYRAELQQRGEAVLWFTLDGFFWLPRILLGVEEHMYAMYDDPELIHRINGDLADWQLRMIEKYAAVASADFMTFAEDMSYNHGPMLSEQMFDELMLPYYLRVTPRLHELGIITMTDSDGDVTTSLPWFERAGIDGVLPLERQAGVDIARFREIAPRMRFIGHFDKMTMPLGREAMAAEFERLKPVAAKGGFIISCDHQTPPGVSYEQYLIYLELFREAA